MPHSANARGPAAAIDNGALWYTLASSRPDMAWLLGMRAQREPSFVSGTAARPPLVVVEL